MASVASQLTEEVPAHAQSDSLEDAREIYADGTYFPNNLRTWLCNIYHATSMSCIQVLLCQYNFLSFFYFWMLPNVMFLYVKHEKGHLLLLYFIQLMQQTIYRSNNSINTDQV